MTPDLFSLTFGFILGVFFTLAAYVVSKRRTESLVAKENARLGRLHDDLRAYLNGPPVPGMSAAECVERVNTVSHCFARGDEGKESA